MKRIIYILISIVLIINSFGCNFKINEKRIISMNKLQTQAGQSKQDLDKYKSEIEKELTNLSKKLSENKEIYVTITFNKLLTGIQVSNLISKYNLKPAMILFRGIEKGSGMRTTGATQINGSNDVKRIHKPGDFRGFIELVADVKNKDLLSLATDENVYLVDPLADDHYISNRDRDYRKGMFWELEDLKLVKSADAYDIKSTNIEEARMKAKSFDEFKTEMEILGFSIETKNLYALNGLTNHRLEFNLSILQMAEYKYIHFEFPDEAIEENLNIESVVAIDHTATTLIGVTESNGVEMHSEGGVWKVSYKEGLDNYWFGFYIKPRNKQLQSNGELILSHGDYHWRGSY